MLGRHNSRTNHTANKQFAGIGKPIAGGASLVGGSSNIGGLLLQTVTIDASLCQGLLAPGEVCFNHYEHIKCHGDTTTAVPNTFPINIILM